MPAKLLAVSLLLTCLATHAQKKSFKERIVLTLGAGASEVNQTYGDAANDWRGRFSYKFGVGYRFSDRFDAGIGVWGIELKPSNALYAPSTSGIVLVRQETKGERFTLVGLYAKVIPIASLSRLSLQADYGLSQHYVMPDFDYSQNGGGYSLTVSYNIIRDELLRVEPYLAFGASVFNDKIAHGDPLSGRSYKNISIGIQLVFTH